VIAGDLDYETLHSAACDLIEIAVFDIDESLRKVAEYDAAVPKADVINTLLDVRQTLSRYYVVANDEEGDT
jgi:hypothetical protein